MAVKVMKENRDTWTKETRALAKVCDSTGYRLVDAYWDGGLLVVQIDTVANYAKDVIVKKRRDDGSIVIKALALGFGPLSCSEYDEFAAQVSDTNQLLKALNEFDFDKLEHIN